MSDAPPQVNAFLICDQAFQQMPTGKWCIIGTFGVIWAREFPVDHSPLVVFVALSQFPGAATVEVHIRNDEGGIVHAVRAQIPRLPDEAQGTAEFAFPFPPVRFVRPGSYTLELISDAHLLSARSFRVDEPPKNLQGQIPPWLTPRPPAGDEPA